MSKIKAILEQGAKVAAVAATGAAAVWGAKNVAKKGFSEDTIRVELENNLRGKSHQERAQKSKENTGQGRG